MIQKKIVFTVLHIFILVISVCGQTSWIELKEKAKNGDKATKLEVAKEFYKRIKKYDRENPGGYSMGIHAQEIELRFIMEELIGQNYQPAIEFAQENNNFKDYAKELTKTTFLEKVMDYEKSPNEWKFRGDKPALIDFYADWCGPCKTSSPILEQIAKEYNGKVDVYKVDTDVERELASVFGIQSIPSFLYIPLTGKPTMASGIAKSKEDTEKMFRENIETLLLSEN